MCYSKAPEWKQDGHHCHVPKGARVVPYGCAVYDCWEAVDGTLWVDCDGEYGNTVNFCPFCGYKAVVQIEEAGG